MLTKTTSQVWSKRMGLPERDPMPPDPRQLSDNLQRLREGLHPACIVCGSQNLRSLQLHCQVLPDGSVQASFECRRILEGYERTLHGGIVCALLDGAMTHCLFAHACVGLTAELRVRFHHPVMAEHPVLVRARITDSYHRLHYLAAGLQQDGRTMASATAKFMETAERGGTHAPNPMQETRPSSGMRQR